MSDITTEYLDLSTIHRHHDDDIIIQVYREFGFGWSFARSFRYPGMLDPRPTHCPGTIDLFLWGGLSTAVTEVFMPVAMTRTRLSCGVTAFMLILVCGPLVGRSLTPFQWMFPSADGATSVSFLVYILYSLSVVLLSQALLYLLVRPLTTRVNDDLRNAIRELEPHFRRVGHDLVYENRRARCGAYDAYVRITTVSPMDVGHQLHEGANVGPPASVGPDFRVLVYGSHCGSYWAWAMGLKLCHRDYYAVTEGRPADLKFSIDKFTWGAVATELRPLSLSYASKSRSLQWNGFLLYLLGLQLYDFIDADIAGEIVMFALICIFPAVIYSAFLQPYLMEKLHGAELRLQLEEKIQSLSSPVEARSGFSLKYGCNGRFDSFVCFQARDSNHSASTAIIV